MKRMFVTTVLIGVIATQYLMVSAVQAAPEPGTPRGKEHYSSRPKNYIPPTMFGPTFETDSWQTVPSEVVIADGPIAAMPTSAPMPAPLLRRDDNSGARKTLEHKPTLLKAPTAGSTPTPKTIKPEPIVITELSESRPISSVEVTGMPVQPKAVPALVHQTPIPSEKTPKNDDDAAVLNFVPRKVETKAETTEEPKAEKNVWVRQPNTEPTEDPINDLDEFNARLAKIQLEKHNLTETLTLIGKIKSPNFKVKTLVELAEYVSRDSDYKREADTLYALAVDGIEALDAGKPVVVKAPVRTAPKGAPTYQPPKPAPPTKATPTLIEEKVEAPAAKPEPKTEAKPEPKVEPEPVTPQPSSPSTKRPPVLLDEEPIVKSEEPKTDPETKTEKKEEPKETPFDGPTLAPSMSESKRRPSLLMTEEEPNTVAPPTAAPKTEGKKLEPILIPPPASLKKEEEPAAAPTPKSTKRAMPGKRITLDAN